jgi:hypothetical protein
MSRSFSAAQFSGRVGPLTVHDLEVPEELTCGGGGYVAQCIEEDLGRASSTGSGTTRHGVAPAIAAEAGAPRPTLLARLIDATVGMILGSQQSRKPTDD